LFNQRKGKVIVNIEIDIDNLSDTELKILYKNGYVSLSGQELINLVLKKHRAAGKIKLNMARAKGT